MPLQSAWESVWSPAGCPDIRMSVTTSHKTHHLVLIYLTLPTGDPCIHKSHLRAFPIDLGVKSRMLQLRVRSGELATPGGAHIDLICFLPREVAEIRRFLLERRQITVAKLMVGYTVVDLSAQNANCHCETSLSEYS